MAVSRTNWLAARPEAAWLAETSGTTVGFEKAMGAFYVAYGVGVFGLSKLRAVTTPGLAVFAELQFTGWRRATA